MHKNVNTVHAMQTRIIGRYEGRAKGPLLICIGGMHGNEHAGIKSIEEVLTLLEIEAKSNPDFRYSGNFLGIRGNLTALLEKRRFINRDLNRLLTQSDMDRIRNMPSKLWTVEDKESYDLIETIEGEINKYAPDLTLILDLHTTTADGGVFTISADDHKSRQLALALHAPVILGVSEGLIGTTIEYFNRPFADCYCIVFEAGQHEDPACVDRSVAAIINCMKSIGSVNPEDADHKHDGLLSDISRGLPKLTRLVYHYKILPTENFVMKSGYKNFQPIDKGEELATNASGIIHAPCSGFILMPKYQLQGEDGFFIVAPEEE